LQISNKTQPEVDAILDVQELFASYPFGYYHLQRRHKIHLVRVCVDLLFTFFGDVEKYFTCSSLKELFENVDATTIMDSVKETNFCHV